MKNLKQNAQYTFMVLLLLLVFGIYSELREFNNHSNANLVSQIKSNHVGSQEAKFMSLDIPPLSSIPTVTFKNFGTDKDYKAVPIVMINSTDYEWD